MTFTTQIRDRKSISCKLCGGLMVWQDTMTYRCVDCRKVARAIDTGWAENEFLMEIADEE